MARKPLIINVVQIETAEVGPHQQAEAIKRREAGEPIREIARSYNVHNSTISRLQP